MTAQTNMAAGMAAPESDGALGPMLLAARRQFAAAGIDSAALDARLLAAHALGWTPARVAAHPEHALSRAERRRFEALIRRRLGREPVALILGRREFWGLEFKVTPATLIPRPESETLIERALAHVDARLAPEAAPEAEGREAKLSVLDLGTGSGCLLLALLHELLNASGLGVDVSGDALAVARDNAERLGLAGRAAFRAGDWADGVQGEYDLVVANPPYIADGAFASLMPEVARFEPRLALSGGPDGLDCYRALFAGLGRLLAKGGVALVEIGATQEAPVRALAEGSGLRVSAVHADLAGHPRVVEAGAEIS